MRRTGWTGWTRAGLSNEDVHWSEVVETCLAPPFSSSPWSGSGSGHRRETVNRSAQTQPLPYRPATSEHQSIRNQEQDLWNLEPKDGSPQFRCVSLCQLGRTPLQISWVGQARQYTPFHKSIQMRRAQRLKEMFLTGKAALCTLLFVPQGGVLNNSNNTT